MINNQQHSTPPTGGSQQAEGASTAPWQQNSCAQPLGGRNNTPAINPAHVVQPQASAEVEQPVEERKSSKWIMIGGGVVAAVVITIVVICCCFGKSSSHPEKTSDKTEVKTGGNVESAEAVEIKKRKKSKGKVKSSSDESEESESEDSSPSCESKNNTQTFQRMKGGCCCLSRPGCSSRPDGRVNTRDDVSTFNRFCFPWCTVAAVDGCGASALISYILTPMLAGFGGSIYALAFWKPEADAGAQAAGPANQVGTPEIRKERKYKSTSKSSSRRKKRRKRKRKD